MKINSLNLRNLFFLALWTWFPINGKMPRFERGYDVVPNHKYLLIFQKIFLPLAQSLNTLRTVNCLHTEDWGGKFHRSLLIYLPVDKVPYLLDTMKHEGPSRTLRYPFLLSPCGVDIPYCGPTALVEISWSEIRFFSFSFQQHDFSFLTAFFMFYFSFRRKK